PNSRSFCCGFEAVNRSTALSWATCSLIVPVYDAEITETFDEAGPGSADALKPESNRAMAAIAGGKPGSRPLAPRLGASLGLGQKRQLNQAMIASNNTGADQMSA